MYWCAGGVIPSFTHIMFISHDIFASNPVRNVPEKRGPGYNDLGKHPALLIIVF
jgi:hypothetical protein